MPFLFCVVIISTILTGKNVTFLVLHVIGIIKPGVTKLIPPLLFVQYKANSTLQQARKILSLIICMPTGKTWNDDLVDGLSAWNS